MHLYRELLVETRRRRAELHLSVAHALKTLGRREEAIESYRPAAAVRPGFGDAYWSLANLKTYRFTDDEIARMRAAEAAPATPLVDRYPSVLRARQGARGRAGSTPNRSHFYERGNALKKSESRYRPESIERNTRLQIVRLHARVLRRTRRGIGLRQRRADFHRGTAARRLDAARADPRFAFAGRRHAWSWPTSRGSCRNCRAASPTDADPRYPGVLARPAAADFQRLGEKYLADTRVYRTGKPRFIDKMPNNFRHIGLIHLILPNAKIIDARREPMACCFSNFKQLFASGQEFTYSLDDIGRYYRSYVELMQHWDRVLPGKILRVQHEDVVEDLEGSVRRILEFCGLPFESAVRGVLQDRAQRAHGQLRASPPTHFQGRLGPVASLRTVARPPEGCSRRGGADQRFMRVFPKSIGVGCPVRHTWRIARIF